MTEEQNKGFRVVDRRISAQQPTEEKPEPASEQPAGAGQPAENAENVQGPGWKMREEQARQALPPMDFTTFCLSLASSAMIHLGESPHPESGQTEPNLPLAKQTVDILALIEEKTRGNLTPEESRLLSTLLYDLRMRYVEATKR